jgi:hypothetical protein
MIIQSQFRPAWWMTNRHAQTILPRLYPVKLDFVAHHQDFNLNDGDFVELTWTQKTNKVDPSKPIVIVLHGLEGSFESFYASRMLNAVHNQGWTGVLMHFRNCGKKANRKATSYHSGQTADVHELIKYLRHQFPSTSISAVGFSLGGNVLAKYLGEEPDNDLTAGVVVSAPLELEECANTMEVGFAKVYQKYLVDKLKNSTLKKIDSLPNSTEIPIDEEALSALVKLRDFDEHVTAPLNGFDNAKDYYQKSSAKQFLVNINKPTLIIHAKDDPFMNEKVIPKQSELSDSITFELCKNGGHVGFISGNHPFKPVFWTEKRAMEFIAKQVS